MADLTRVQWKEIFDASDRDATGFVEKSELPAIFEKLNVKLDETSTANLVKKFDKNKDGKLNFPEYQNMITYILEEKSKALEKQGGSTGFGIFGKKTAKAPTKKIAGASILSRFTKVTSEIKQKTQNVQKLDSKFVDPEFKPDDSNLTLPQRGKGITWRRPSEISPNPQLFVAGTEEGDVKQGHIGNCWFIGALAVVAASGSELVEVLFVRSNPEEGRYHIRFYKDFDWVVVEIDDLLPCVPDGRLLYAKCPDANEFWVPLVEKAYAKLHGGYDQIESGTITDALRDLTGEGVEVLDIRTLPNKDDLWPVLVHNTAESFLMGCAIEASGAPERLTNEGLLTNHAYSILDCKEFKGNKLVRVRNPWGQGEWKGAWSDGSKEWTPAAKKALEYVDENDGTFYMSYNDFSARFNIVHVLRLLTDEVGEVWQKSVFRSSWKGPTAGGCSDHPTWHQNPQFSVTTSNANNKVFVCISQPDQRYATDSSKISYEPIGAIVLLGKDDPYKKTTLKKDDVVLRPHYAPRRDISFEFTANPGNSYIIIPTGFKPGFETAFEIAIYTQKSAKIIERNGSMPAKQVEGQWSGKTAGGCPNFPTWTNNPQFNLSSRQTVKATISLDQKSADKKNVEPIGFVVFPAANAGERVSSYSKNPPINAPSFTPAPLVQAEVTLEGGKQYVVLPCTFNPGREKRFHIAVSTGDEASLQGITIHAI